MDIHELNKKHYVETDLYYRMSLGLSSRLICYQNEVIYIEVIIGRKWNKNYNATAAEIAYCWKSNHKELSNAIGCKVFIVDAREEDYKFSLIDAGITPTYNAYKGILFRKNYLN